MTKIFAGVRWHVICVVAAVACSSPEDEVREQSNDAGSAGRAGSATAGKGGSNAAGSTGQPNPSGGRSGAGGRSATGGRSGAAGNGTSAESGEGGQADGQGGSSRAGSDPGGGTGGAGAGANNGGTGGAGAGANNGGTAGDAASGGSTSGASGSSTAGRGGSNTVTDGPIRISENGRYLTDGEGTPILLFGEGAWTLNSQLSVEDQNEYLDDRSSRGLNAFGLQLISRYQDNSPNDIDGVAPFTTPGDFATFNAPYFAKAADMVGRAGERGIIVFIAPTWAGYDSGQGFYQTMVSNGEAKVRDYGSAVANVFKDFDNVVWIIGGDMRPPIQTPLFDALSAGIRAVDDRHLLTSHWNFAPGDSPSGDWEDIVSCYDWNNGVQYTQVRTEYEENDAPVVLLEALYELNTDYGATTKILRMQTIQALLFGAKGAFFGHEGIWALGASVNLPPQSRNKPYDLNSIGIQQQERVMDFFRERAWHELVPDLSSELVTSGRGSYGNIDYVGAAKTPDGELGIAYVPAGGTIGVDMSKLSLPTRARWFDPTNGAFEDAGTFGDAAIESLTPPDQNSTGDDDFILVLESD